MSVAFKTGFTVMWTSSHKNLAYVEVAPDDGTPFELCTRPRFYNVVAGRRVADTFHSVHITGLEPGKSYRYRIYAKVINDDSNAYGVDYGPARRVKFKGEATIRTLDRNAEKCRFFMANDIHLNDDRYKGVVKGVKSSDFDFFVMNGDMASYISEADTMLRHVFHVVPSLTSSIPTVYTRGNHETRGRDAHLLPKFCPTSTGRPYYLLRQGPVAILVLDGGEDKPDSDLEYYETAVYDQFRREEAEWLKKVVESEECKSAKHRIVLMHMAPIGGKNMWHGPKHAGECFFPILNNANITVMLSGHTHRYSYNKPEETGAEFPILVNSNSTALKANIDANGIKISVIDMTGAVKYTHTFK